jgi:structural maintenance of chromosome 2
VIRIGINITIVKDANTAKEITFHPNIRMRSVTLEGDLYDPSGSLSGGSRSTGSGLLIKMKELRMMESQIVDVQNQLSDVQVQLQEVEAGFVKRSQVRQNLDLKQHELKLLAKQLASNSNSKVIQLVMDLKDEIAHLETVCAEALEKKREALAKQKAIKKEMDEFNNNKDSKLKTIQVIVYVFRGLKVDVLVECTY